MRLRWWPWRRRELRHAWAPPQRIPDGDTVLAPGQRRWADLLDQHAPEPSDWLTEPTQPLPVYRPLLTPDQAWRSQGGRSAVSTAPTMTELVAALRLLGCEGPAAAADVLDHVSWPRPLRDQVLRAMATVERYELSDQGRNRASGTPPARNPRS